MFLQNVVNRRIRLPILQGVTAASNTTDIVESLKATIAQLQRERQQLRADGASAEALERNRLEIARAQQRLSQALIEKYTPAAA